MTAVKLGWDCTLAGFILRSRSRVPRANKIELFSRLPKVDHLIKSCKASIHCARGAEELFVARDY